MRIFHVALIFTAALVIHTPAVAGKHWPDTVD